MKKLYRENYCQSCAHILEERKKKFEKSTRFVGEPSSLAKRKCLLCGQIIEPNIDKIASDYNLFLSSLKNPKLFVVAYVAPSVRAGIAECFGAKGDMQQKVVTALKLLGCKQVFSMNFGADLTIMEESAELLGRLNSKTNLPLLTSCCPAWVSYVDKCYPSAKKYLSTCKSPQQMLGALINTYYRAKTKQSNLFVVSIVPCYAKKIERITAKNSGVGYDVDAAITTTELAQIIKSKNIDFINLADSPFDQMFGEYSASGANFGTSGGVSEACIKNIDSQAKITTLSSGNITEKYVVCGKHSFYMAQVQGVINAKPIIESILSGKCKYSFVEVMACTGGCIGGAGQPKTQNLSYRKQMLNDCLNNPKIANAKNNKTITELYSSVLAGEKAKKYFHND